MRPAPYHLLLRTVAFVVLTGLSTAMLALPYLVE